jgi:hypothetical protein
MLPALICNLWHPCRWLHDKRYKEGIEILSRVESPCSTHTRMLLQYVLYAAMQGATADTMLTVLERHKQYTCQEGWLALAKCTLAEGNIPGDSLVVDQLVSQIYVVAAKAQSQMQVDGLLYMCGLCVEGTHSCMPYSAELAGAQILTMHTNANYLQGL